MACVNPPASVSLVCRISRLYDADVSMKECANERRLQRHQRRRRPSPIPFDPTNDEFRCPDKMPNLADTLFSPVQLSVGAHLSTRARLEG